MRPLWKWMIEIIRADWPATERVQAFTTTRSGGVSEDCYQSLNLASHVNDNPAHVERNRQRLRQQLNLPADPLWLNQTHSTQVICADNPLTLDGDAAFSRQANTVCTVLTADCLPVLIANKAGDCVAAAHAGWRGLLAGVIENTINAMAQNPDELMVWIGPAISAHVFEVGADVRQAFMDAMPDGEQAFEQTDESHWLADMVKLARMKLHRKGIDDVYGGDYCSYQNAQQFFSYRRDGETGRMGSFIWVKGIEN